MKTPNSIKILTAAIAVFCCLNFQYSFAQSKGKQKVKRNDSLELAKKFLTFTCKLTTVNKLTNPIDVILYSNDKVVDHKVLDKKLKFEYLFRRDSSYILQISAPFYITRYVIINTDMPRKMQDDMTIYVHDMEMELMEQPKTYYTADINSDILDEPITIIRYVSQKNNFNTDPRYTRKMKRELRMFKKSIDKLTSAEPNKK